MIRAPSSGEFDKGEFDKRRVTNAYWRSYKLSPPQPGRSLLLEESAGFPSLARSLSLEGLKEDESKEELYSSFFLEKLTRERSWTLDESGNRREKVKHPRTDSGSEAIQSVECSSSEWGQGAWFRSLSSPPRTGSLTASDCGGSIAARISQQADDYSGSGGGGFRSRSPSSCDEGAVGYSLDGPPSPSPLPPLPHPPSRFHRPAPRRPPLPPSPLPPHVLQRCDRVEACDPGLQHWVTPAVLAGLPSSAQRPEIGAAAAATVGTGPMCLNVANYDPFRAYAVHGVRLSRATFGGVGGGGSSSWVAGAATAAADEPPSCPLQPAVLVLMQNFLFEYSAPPETEPTAAASGPPIGFAALSGCDARRCGGPNGRVVRVRTARTGDGAAAAAFGLSGGGGDGGCVTFYLLAATAEAAEVWEELLRRLSSLRVCDLFKLQAAHNGLRAERPLLRESVSHATLGRGRFACVKRAHRRSDASWSDRDDGYGDDGGYGDSVSATGLSGGTRRGSGAGDGGVGGKVAASCALKIFDKAEFWRRVHRGQERFDTLVREAAVQAILTAAVANADEAGALSHGGCCGVGDGASSGGGVNHRSCPVVRLLGIFEDTEYLVLEMELMSERSLFHELSHDGVMEEGETARVAAGLLKAVVFMQGLGIAHRDIKLSNVLFLPADATATVAAAHLAGDSEGSGEGGDSCRIGGGSSGGGWPELGEGDDSDNGNGDDGSDDGLDECGFAVPSGPFGDVGAAFGTSRAAPPAQHRHGEVRLADFGMAGQVDAAGQLRGRCGTPGYVAPEILAAGPAEPYSNAVDVYSVGVVAYTLLCGYEPFYGRSDAELIAQNRDGDFSFDVADWGAVAMDAQDFVSRLMEKDPTHRASPQEALRHPWILRHVPWAAAAAAEAARAATAAAAEAAAEAEATAAAAEAAAEAEATAMAAEALALSAEKEACGVKRSVSSGAAAGHRLDGFKEQPESVPEPLPQHCDGSYLRMASGSSGRIAAGAHAAR